jgi:hypothetical protein
MEQKVGRFVDSTGTLRRTDNPADVEALRQDAINNMDARSFLGFYNLLRPDNNQQDAGGSRTTAYYDFNTGKVVEGPSRGLEDTSNYGSFKEQVESGSRGMADPVTANARTPIQINPNTLNPKSYLQTLANQRLMKELGLYDVPSLYKMIYGRDPDPSGLGYYQDLFGDYIEPEEIDRFIGGAQGSDLPTAQTAQEYLQRTGDQEGARRILEASAGNFGTNQGLTRDLLQLYRPELADPFSQLSAYGTPGLIDRFFPGYVPPQKEQEAPGGPGGPGAVGQQPGGVFGLIPGSIIPMSGTDMQRALASYSPDSIGSRLASGYRQVFGRDIDPAGAKYWLERFGDQNLSQAEINRYLLGGAAGEDKAASKDYEMSLTGGRPSADDRQYFQPIYSSDYRDYMPARPAQQQSYFGPGFNPFDYTGTPNILQSPGFGNQTFNPPGLGIQTPIGDRGTPITGTAPNPINIPQPDVAGPMSPGPTPESRSMGIAEAPVSSFVENILNMRGLTAMSTPSGGLDFVPIASNAAPSIASGGSSE